MKLLKYFIILLIPSVFSCSKNRVVLTDGQINNEILYLEGEIKPFSGICIIPYRDGKTIREVRRYEKGIVEGEAFSYYIDGKLKIKGKYDHGKMAGTWEKWYSDGRKAYEANFKNDSMTGFFKEWYANGNIKEEGQYKNNTKVGEWNFYGKKGELLYTKNYEAVAVSLLTNKIKTGILN